MPQVHHHKSPTAFYRFKTHGELGNGALPRLLVGGVKGAGIDIDIEGLYAWYEIVKVAEGDAKREAVP